MASGINHAHRRTLVAQRDLHGLDAEKTGTHGIGEFTLPDTQFPATRIQGILVLELATLEVLAHIMHPGRRCR